MASRLFVILQTTACLVLPYFAADIGNGPGFVAFGAEPQLQQSVADASAGGAASYTFGAFWPPVLISRLPPVYPQNAADFLLQAEFAWFIDQAFAPNAVLSPTTRTYSSNYKIALDELSANDHASLACCPTGYCHSQLRGVSCHTFATDSSLLESQLLRHTRIEAYSGQPFYLASLWPQTGKGGKTAVTFGCGGQAPGLTVAGTVVRLKIMRPWVSRAVFENQLWHGRQILKEEGALASGINSPQSGLNDWMSTEVIILRNGMIEGSAKWSPNSDASKIKGFQNIKLAELNENHIYRFDDSRSQIIIVGLVFERLPRSPVRSRVVRSTTNVPR